MYKLVITKIEPDPNHKTKRQTYGYHEHPPSENKEVEHVILQLELDGTKITGMSDITEEAIKEEFIKFYQDMQYADDFIPSKEAIIADWWLDRLEEAKAQAFQAGVEATIEAMPDTWQSEELGTLKEQLKQKFLKQ